MLLWLDWCSHLSSGITHSASYLVFGLAEFLERGPQCDPMKQVIELLFERIGFLTYEVPWRKIFKSKAVWAMIYAHFRGSWSHYSCLSWIPTYFSEELILNLTSAAWVSGLPPPLASILLHPNLLTA